MPTWTDKYSFLAGVVARSTVGGFALADDSIDSKKIPHSQIVFWNSGQWGNSGPVVFTTVGLALVAHPTRQMVAIGPFGEAFLTGPGDLHEERIGTIDDGPSKRGMLRAVRGIGGKAYAVGMQRQVYRRDGVDLWVSIDRDMRPKSGDVLGFESIDGFNEEDIYTVGWEGEIWHFSSGEWIQITSPTNAILTDVCCGEDGKVYACGRQGLLLVGRNSQWQVIEHESMAEDIWSLAWFKGSLYASTYRGIFRLNSGRLARVDLGNDEPSTYYKLSAVEDAMWSIGAKDVMAFDGDFWKRIE